MCDIFSELKTLGAFFFFGVGGWAFFVIIIIITATTIIIIFFLIHDNSLNVLRFKPRKCKTCLENAVNFLSWGGNTEICT